MTVKDFKKCWPKFRTWLETHGSEVLTPTNQYEVARFLSAEGVGVVYTDGDGWNITSWVNGAQEAYDAWKDQKPWRAKEKQERKSRGAKQRAILIRSLADRDGWDCVYCGQALTGQTATIEHIVPIGRRGYDGIANMTLACRDCNKAVGHMTARQKIEHALAKRGR